MNRAPRIADLFCGAGGAGMGLHRAGFEVVGFDIKDQPRYPFEFHQRDVMTMTPEELREFDAVWASPPCQHGSRAVLNAEKGRYPALIEPTRQLAIQTGKPYILENVEGAAVVPHIKLCGLMFGLQLIRHRWFETSHLIFQPGHQKHQVSLHNGNLAKYDRLDDGAPFVTVAGHLCSKKDAEIAMGIDWMVRAELTQAIPPAYSEYLGKELLKVLAPRAP